MALGATRWQVVRRVVLPTARSGIAAAVTLALGRAMGEAIVVALVIGNRPALPHSLIAPGATLGSAIVNQFAEAQPGLGTSSVIALAAVLLVLTVAVNIGGQILRRAGKSSGSTAYFPAGAPGGAALPVEVPAPQAVPKSRAAPAIAAPRAAEASSAAPIVRWDRGSCLRRLAGGLHRPIDRGSAGTPLPAPCLRYRSVSWSTRSSPSGYLGAVSPPPSPAPPGPSAWPS